MVPLSPNISGLFCGLLLLLLSIPHRLSAEEPLTTVPGSQTFEAFVTALATLESKTTPDEVKKEIESVRQMIERGKLLLIARRTERAAIIAEKTGLRIEVIRLKLELDRLKREAATKKSALAKQKSRLESLRRCLEKEKRARATSTETTDNRQEER